jgi:hypothetical protein
MPDLGSLEHDIGASKTPPPDRAIAEIAARQHGVVARRQVVALGLGRGAIRHRLDAGRLHRVHVGVYAVGHSILSARGRWLAAVLACGDGALLSHRPAAAVWGIASSNGARVDVTVHARNGHGPAAIRLHRVRNLHPEDRAVRDGIPVTSVARTLLDYAEVARRDQLARAFEEAERRELLDMRAVEELLDRSDGRRGQRALTTVIAGYAPEPRFTRSDLERLLLALCRDYGLPLPAMNLWIAGHEVDAVWPDLLVVEVDGYKYHRTRAAFERDRRRDADLQVAGYRVLRITYRRLVEEPAAVAESIRALL